MKSIYEIDVAITSLVDPETGEILDYEAFSDLAMERDQKVEGMALWYKDLLAEAAAIKSEETTLSERRKKLEAKAERLKTYLSELLGGDKFKTARVACSFRTSTSLAIADEAEFVRKMELEQRYEFLTYKDPQINKTEITKAIKAGQTVEGAELVKKSNISIK